MSYCHEWITNTGILPGYDKIMKKEIKKDDILYDSQGAEEKRYLSDKKTKEPKVW